MTSRDRALYWWPVIARGVGAVGGVGQIALALLTHQSADVAGLGFCTALVAAPAIFPTEPNKPKEEA